MKTLVLVHGFMGGSAQWDAQEQALSIRFNVVTVDLPGFGQNADQPAPDRMSDFAAYVLDTLTELHIDRFHLLGHSMGGMIVQEMIATAPERIEKLILYGTGASGALPGRFESIATSKKRAEQDGAGATARRISATWFLDYEKAPAYETCAAIAEHSSLQAIDAGLDAMDRWTRVSDLARISAPTLVVWGDQDRTYNWAQTEELWTSIPGSQLAVIPGCAHAVHMEKTTIFNAIIEDFLANSTHVRNQP